MQELEKILEEIDETIERYVENPYIDEKVTDLCYGMNIAKGIIRKYISGKDTDVPAKDGWIPVEERMPERWNISLHIYWRFSRTGRAIHRNVRDRKWYMG